MAPTMTPPGTMSFRPKGIASGGVPRVCEIARTPPHTAPEMIAARIPIPRAGSARARNTCQAIKFAKREAERGPTVPAQRGLQLNDAKQTLNRATYNSSARKDHWSRRLAAFLTWLGWELHFIRQRQAWVREHPRRTDTSGGEWEELGT